MDHSATLDHSATFARHFARLVSLLMHEMSNVDEQKMSLRALVTLSKSGGVTMWPQELHLLANGVEIPGALTGVQDTASQMTAHSLSRVEIGTGAKAADLLGLARIVAATAAPGDGGAQVKQKLTALNAKRITFEVPAPPAPPVVSAEAPTVKVEVDARAAANALAAAAAPAKSIFSELIPADVSKHTPDELFGLLDKAQRPDDHTRVLDDLVSLAEHSVRVGKGMVVGDIFEGVVKRDAQIPDGDVKRAYSFAIRRMAKPALLRAVATLIPKKPERKQHFYEVLERTAEEGAEALIEQISQAQTTEDRRALFEVLTELPAATPALTRMLGDSRWFVVRNAADLLGEMAAKGAEDALIDLLRHTDDRVRRSATNALLKLGTPNALKTIYEAVNDASPEVRMQAAAAISTKRDGRTSMTLIRAIEDEGDADVQIAMIAALGRVGTSDAVQKLLKLAEPDSRLFRKKPTNIRVAAVQALGEVKSPAAVAALKELAGDKEREVRDTATRALAHSR
jgi:HEAT repeat protein